jgi:hypothetical protein
MACHLLLLLLAALLLLWLLLRLALLLPCMRAATHSLVSCCRCCAESALLT